LRDGTRSLWQLGLAALFGASAACGAEPANLDEDCPQDTGAGGATTTASTGPSQASSQVASSSVASSGVGGGSVASSGVGGGSEGPMFETPNADEIASRLHACHKLSYAQVGTFLRSRGAPIPPTGVGDLKTTTVSVLGSNQTLGALFGGGGAACEMQQTAGLGSSATDPTCPAGQACFCNQSDKANVANPTCLDSGSNEAADGYCVAKPSTAAFLYFTGRDAFGVPKLNSRRAETEEHSTASASKLMDIFIQAAPHIIANIGDPVKAPACTLGGKNRPMFDTLDGSCVPESLSCVLGMPASDDHLLLCNLIVAKATQGDAADLARKRAIAVAVLMSGTHACQ